MSSRSFVPGICSLYSETSKRSVAVLVFFYSAQFPFAASLLDINWRCFPHILRQSDEHCVPLLDGRRIPGGNASSFALIREMDVFLSDVGERHQTAGR